MGVAGVMGGGSSGGSSSSSSSSSDREVDREINHRAFTRPAIEHTQAIHTIDPSFVGKAEASLLMLDSGQWSGNSLVDIWNRRRHSHSRSPPLLLRLRSRSLPRVL